MEGKWRSLTLHSAARDEAGTADRVTGRCRRPPPSLSLWSTPCSLERLHGRRTRHASDNRGAIARRKRLLRDCLAGPRRRRLPRPDCRKPEPMALLRRNTQLPTCISGHARTHHRARIWSRLRLVLTTYHWLASDTPNGRVTSLHTRATEAFWRSGTPSSLKQGAHATRLASRRRLHVSGSPRAVEVPGWSTPGCSDERRRGSRVAAIARLP